MSFMSRVCHAVDLFFAALWSPEGKGPTSWHLFLIFIVILLLSHWYPGTSVVLDSIDS